MKDCKGRIHSIESFSVKDGPGIRSVVFMQGCFLRCVYCHNPDTWDFGGGQEISASELAKKISRFKPYFSDGGGVTLSGGEPLAQAEFAYAFFEEAKALGIHRILDTAGYALTDSVKACLGAADEVSLDFKFSDADSYRRYTGGRIETFFAFLEECQRQNKPVTLKTVVVPDLNDSEEQIRRYYEAVKGYSVVKEFKLLAFHTLGFQKYESLGLKNPLSGKNALENEKFTRLSSFLQQLCLQKA